MLIMMLVTPQAWRAAHMSDHRSVGVSALEHQITYDM